MKKIILLLLLSFLTAHLFAQHIFKAKVLDSNSKQPVAGAVVQVVDQKNKTALTDINGSVEIKGIPAGTMIIRISILGHKPKTDTIIFENNQTVSKRYYLEEAVVNLSQIEVSAKKDENNSLSSIDFKLRPHLTTQDLLRMVPGLFIAQHAGGGKAEQLYMRGFDVDHGTDVAIFVDNMPVNMVSQAHGQGYADLHFVIPETVEKISFAKGPYDAKTGDFNTAGAVRFQTKNYLSKNFIKLEAGAFNTYRGVTMMNLLHNGDTVRQKQNAYIAAEYFYTNGFFQNPQDFSKVNLFGKYNAEINSSANITFTLSSFSSRWNASGEIPSRAVASGLISKFGSIDPSEGGHTSRYNANLALTKKLDNGDKIQSNLYYVIYNYNLYSNFTFFKEDSVNGDEINQYENRNIVGYNGSYGHEDNIGALVLRSTAGIGLRDDQIGNIGLAHVRKRVFLSDVQKGEIHETNFNAFLEENLTISPKFSVSLGLRFDQFHFAYRNMLIDTVNDVHSKNQAIVSPKANLYYNLTKNLQLYVSAGSGFHSNDARVASQAPGTTLPRAFGADVGTNFKFANRLFVNAAVWLLDMESEYTWSGDEGRFEVNPNGKTRRIGVDVSARFQLLKWLFADMDLNLAKPRFVNVPAGENYVPIAPSMTSVAGLSVRTKNGFTASVRYRYLGARPLIEDNSIRVPSYFIMDAVIGYAMKNISFGITGENLLNAYWKEAPYATESQLKGEIAPVTEVHYTPGTPFNLRANMTLFF